VFHPDGPTFLELARQALSSTERGYDLLAPKFDYTPYRTPDFALAAVREALDDGAAVGAALDVCCGTGAGLEMLARLQPARLVGVDMSAGMLAQAAQNLAAHDAVLELVRGDALNLPFEGEFDVVTCFGAFGHILERDEARFVENVRRALKPGGRFAFVTSEMPPLSSRSYWLARGFNAAIRMRNAVLPHRFEMYYLTFLLPRARALLEARGFAVESRPLGDRLHVVVATKARR